MNTTVAFIGAGRIAEAWIERLVRSGAVPAEGIVACDPDDGRLEHMRSRFPGLVASRDNADGARHGRIVILATPPSETASVSAAVAPVLQRGATVISLAAGVPLEKLSNAAPGVDAARVMPNTPSMVGEGMNLLCVAPGITAEARQTLEWLLNLFGRFLEIGEREMEAYGALCAVGPTFLFPIVQALIAAAAEAGIREDMARMAVAQVVAGTGRLVAGTSCSVAELNGMIGLHTLQEPEAMNLVAEAYRSALEKLKGLAARMAAAAA